MAQGPLKQGGTSAQLIKFHVKNRMGLVGVQLYHFSLRH
jgi:hypothetical protein